VSLVLDFHLPALVQLHPLVDSHRLDHQSSHQLDLPLYHLLVQRRNRRLDLVLSPLLALVYSLQLLPVPPLVLSHPQVLVLSHLLALALCHRRVPLNPPLVFLLSLLVVLLLPHLVRSFSRPLALSPPLVVSLHHLLVPLSHPLVLRRNRRLELVRSPLLALVYSLRLPPALLLEQSHPQVLVLSHRLALPPCRLPALPLNPLLVQVLNRLPVLNRRLVVSPLVVVHPLVVSYPPQALVPHRLVVMKSAMKNAIARMVRLVQVWRSLVVHPQAHSHPQDSTMFLQPDHRRNRQLAPMLSRLLVLVLNPLLDPMLHHPLVQVLSHQLALMHNPQRDRTHNHQLVHLLNPPRARPFSPPLALRPSRLLAAMLSHRLDHQPNRPLDHWRNHLPVQPLSHRQDLRLNLQLVLRARSTQPTAVSIVSPILNSLASCYLPPVVVILS